MTDATESQLKDQVPTPRTTDAAFARAVQHKLQTQRSAARPWRALLLSTGAFASTAAAGLMLWVSSSSPTPLTSPTTDPAATLTFAAVDASLDDDADTDIEALLEQHSDAELLAFEQRLDASIAQVNARAGG